MRFAGVPVTGQAPEGWVAVDERLPTVVEAARTVRGDIVRSEGFHNFCPGSLKDSLHASIPNVVEYARDTMPPSLVMLPRELSGI